MSGSLSLEIKFGRANKTYHDNDVVSGSVVLYTKSEVRHEGIGVDMVGAVQMQLAGKNAGLIEAALASSAKPIQLTSWAGELSKSGRLLPGKTEVPFEIPLSPKLNRILHETYHGVFIVVQYLVKCEVRRSFPNKSLQKTSEFLVEYTKERETEHAMQKPISFTITPESIQNREKSTLPGFSIKGRLDSCACVLGRPLTGEVTVERCAEAIRSVELQLVRVETCGGAEACTRDATEVQTLQIADGDIVRGLPIPIHLVFPRLFTCPSVETPNFKVEFELNIVFLFANDHMIKENFPITLHRYLE